MQQPTGIMRWLDQLVHVVELVTTAVLAFLAAAGVVSLVYETVKAVISLSAESLPQLFGTILLVFILLELYGIGTAFIHKEDVSDKVFEVGLVALVREIIVAEFLHLGTTELLTIAALVLALGIAWFLSRRARAQPQPVE